MAKNNNRNNNNNSNKNNNNKNNNRPNNNRPSSSNNNLPAAQTSTPTQTPRSTPTPTPVPRAASTPSQTPDQRALSSVQGAMQRAGVGLDDPFIRVVYNYNKSAAERDDRWAQRNPTDNGLTRNDLGLPPAPGYTSNGRGSINDPNFTPAGAGGATGAKGGGATGAGGGSSSSNNSTSSQTNNLQSAMKGDNSKRLGYLLKIAAGQGKGQNLVDKKEFNKIYRHFDSSKQGLKITNRMDKINEKQADKKDGYNPMGLQSNVFGKIYNNKYGDGGNLGFAKFAAKQPNPAGNNIMNARNAMFRNGYNLAQKNALGDLGGKYKGSLSKLAINYGNNNLKGVKGFGVYGADANGNAIFANGQGGKSWSENPKLNPKPPVTTDETPGGNQTPGPSNPEPELTPDIPAVETPAAGGSVGGFGTGGAGAAGDTKATGIRSKKSRWKTDGRAYKGTSNLKFNRSAGFGGLARAF